MVTLRSSSSCARWPHRRSSALLPAVVAIAAFGWTVIVTINSREDVDTLCDPRDGEAFLAPGTHSISSQSSGTAAREARTDSASSHFIDAMCSQRSRSKRQLTRRRLFGKSKPAVPANLPATPLLVLPPRTGLYVAIFALIAVAGTLLFKRYKRRLRRPYRIRSDEDVDKVKDPEAEFCKIVNFIQDEVIRPVDKQLRGRPFRYDLHSFPMTPMVLVIGNHSSGKSTFINSLLGSPVQETGVAPTDDGFTILERAETPTVEDGPTILGCPDNRAFQELQRFGDSFTGHFRRKRVVLGDDAAFPFGLQIIDSPGMIDTPGAPSGMRGRGYNFVEVVRWWAKRADVILLLFDPDKPGTTGESLEVLTKSLKGLEYKFRIVLNKVDQLDSTVDFARAYGTLGWALSKVIERKDIPMIYTTYNEGFGKQANSLPLEEFDASRKAVVAEVFRAKERHYDNVLTALEQSLRQVEMMSTVLRHVRARVRRSLWLAAGGSLAVLGTPVAVAESIMYAGLASPGPLALFGACSSYIVMCISGAAFLNIYCKQFQRVQATDDNLDEVFRKEYDALFILDEREDYRTTWRHVRPKIATMLKATSNIALMPSIRSWRIDRVRECYSPEKDLWYLRQLARVIRLSAAKEPCSKTIEAIEAGSKMDKATQEEPIAPSPDKVVESSSAKAREEEKKKSNDQET